MSVLTVTPFPWEFRGVPGSAPSPGATLAVDTDAGTIPGGVTGSTGHTRAVHRSTTDPQEVLMADVTTPTIDIGIAEADRLTIASELGRVLADTYTLYLKTHNYHWNVTGPLFNTLHLMFEVQYNELWLAVDLLAERIRSLGEFAPGSSAGFGELTSIPEADGVPQAETMIADLVAGHEAVARTARTALGIADAAGDQPTVDLLTQRLQVHEKTAWMLRSMLG